MANFIPLTAGRFFKESFILRSRDGHLRRVYIKVVTKSLIQVRKSPIFPINTFLQWPKKIWMNSKSSLGPNVLFSDKNSFILKLPEKSIF